MKCTVCRRDEVGEPASHMTIERLEQLDKAISKPGHDGFYMAVGTAGFVVGELIRWRRRICWTCSEVEKAWQRAEEKRLARAAEAMANEGGRGSA